MEWLNVSAWQMESTDKNLIQTNTYMCILYSCHCVFTCSIGFNFVKICTQFVELCLDISGMLDEVSVGS